MLDKERVYVNNFFDRNEISYPKKFRDVTCFPVYKKGPRNDYTNYRPIILSSGLCNVIEGYANKQFLHF